MINRKQLRLSAAFILAIGYATPALAVTNTRIVITQDQQEVPETRIRLFDADTGTEVRREPEDDDEAGALFLLDGGRYRIVVDGETVREISVTGTGSRTFNISLPPVVPLGEAPSGPLGFLPGSGARDRPTLGLTGGYGRKDVPTTGIGFRRAGAPGTAPEEFAGTTLQRFTIVDGEASLSGPLGGGTRAGIDIGYGEGDSMSSFNVPAGGGVDSGIVYGDLSPSGSSGIATPFGVDGWTRFEANQFSVRAWLIPPIFPDRPPDQASFDISIFAEYVRQEVDIAGFAASSGELAPGVPFAFSQERHQDVSEDYFTLGLGGLVRVPLGGQLFGHLRGNGGLYRRNSNLVSTERNQCAPFCPPDDRDFTIEIRDSHSSWGFRGYGAAAVEFMLSPNVSFVAGGSVNYWSDVAGLFNPNSGDQVFFDGLSTRLRPGDSWSWHANAGIIIRLGGGGTPEAN